MGSDPQSILMALSLQAAHDEARLPESSFEKTWVSLTKKAPNAFTPADKKLAKLFYDVGVRDMLQSITETSKLLVAIPVKPSIVP